MILRALFGDSSWSARWGVPRRSSPLPSFPLDDVFSAGLWCASGPARVGELGRVVGRGLAHLASRVRRCSIVLPFGTLLALCGPTRGSGSLAARVLMSWSLVVLTSPCLFGTHLDPRGECHPLPPLSALTLGSWLFPADPLFLFVAFLGA